MRYLQLAEQFKSGGISVPEAEHLITAMLEEFDEIAQALSDIEQAILNGDDEHALETLTSISLTLNDLDAETIFI